MGRQTLIEPSGPVSYGTLRAANPTTSRYGHTSRRLCRADRRESFTNHYRRTPRRFSTPDQVPLKTVEPTQVRTKARTAHQV